MMMKKRLAIISSHPIQYNAPLFILLSHSELIDLKVFYTFSQGKEQVFDKDFGKQIKWDIPLLEGYSYEFAENISSRPGLDHFRGIINPGLTKAIAQWKPDAILVYGWNYHSHLKVMRHFKGRVPVYFRGDSTLLDEQGGMKSILRRILLKWIYSHVDGAFFVGTNNKKYFLAHGFKEEELFFAPHAIDVRRFSIDKELEEKATIKREELGIGKDETVILFAGKFEPKKDPLSLVRAFKKHEKAGVRLLLVGNGILEDELRKLAGNDRRILFLPFQNQSAMPAVYAMADLFVLPSQGPGETWGLAVNEAMAAGKAILASNKVGCSADLIREGRNGYVFEAGNLTDLEKKLSDLLSSTDILREMGRNSREMISSWSYEHVCKSIVDQVTKT